MRADCPLILKLTHPSPPQQINKYKCIKTLLLITFLLLLHGLALSILVNELVEK